MTMWEKIHSFKELWKVEVAQVVWGAPPLSINFLNGESHPYKLYIVGKGI